jgi:branched-chain amino acid transport system ATP-binding protein
VLELKEVTVRLGGVCALNAVSISVEDHAIHGIIGPNGAGKSTLFNAVTGLVRAEGGIWFDGTDLRATPRHRLAGLGIMRTYQNLALFSELSVLENVMMGVYAQQSGGLLANVLQSPRCRREERAARSAARDALARLSLEQFADRHMGSLPYGVLKRVELARVVVGNPRLVLLDEPAAGLNHAEVADFSELLRQIHRDREEDMSMVIVEHHMGLVMGLCEQISVLNFGQLLITGSPGEVSADPEVIKAYLGKAA